MSVVKHYYMEYGSYTLSDYDKEILAAFINITDDQVDSDPAGEDLAVPLHKLMFWLMSNPADDDLDCGDDCGGLR